MINQATLIGNTGKDPEIRTTSSGKKVATFSLATSETRKNDGGDKITTTMWHNVVAWSPLAEIAESYIKKGQQLFVQGRINYREYTASDGTTKHVTEIVAQAIQMLGSKKQDDIAIRPEPQATDNQTRKSDLPFDEPPF